MPPRNKSGRKNNVISDFLAETIPGSAKEPLCFQGQPSWLCPSRTVNRKDGFRSECFELKDVPHIHAPACMETLVSRTYNIWRWVDWPSAGGNANQPNIRKDGFKWVFCTLKLPTYSRPCMHANACFTHIQQTHTYTPAHTCKCTHTEADVFPP